MAEQIVDLNYDFNYNLFLAKRMLSHLETNAQRQRVLRWMRKLLSAKKCVEEMKLRNDFMYYMVLNIQNRELKPPFHENPPPGPLPRLAHLLPGNTVQSLEEAGAWVEQEANKKPLIYENSPDGGEFLASQPIPRCGAFCYLAVVSKSSK